MNLVGTFTDFEVIRMGLLDKTNPYATPKSTLCHAAVIGIVGAVLYIAFSIWKPDLLIAWFIKLPAWVVLCAIVGGLFEWQVDNASDLDGTEDDEQ